MQLQLGSKQLSVEHLQVLHNLLVTPVKNPQVATNKPQPYSITILSLACPSFFHHAGFYCPQRICLGHQGNFRGVPRTFRGTPKHILGAPRTLLGVPKHC